MKPYTMTQADAQLILDHAGAMNVGRALVQPAERFGNTGIPADPNSPSIKWSHVDELNALAARILAGDPETPQTAVEVTPPLKASETRSIDGGQPGILYTIQLEAGGPASVEISGSPLVTQSVGAKGVAKTEGRWAQGAGTASPIASSPGEWLTWSYDAPQGGQTMRPQVLAA